MKPAERRAEILATMEGSTDWFRPMDVGGHNGSKHWYDMACLAKAGVLERRQRGAGWGGRGSWEYRMVPA